jgi:hypothetical protein
LLGDWVVERAQREGRLRHLTVLGEAVSYRYGLPESVPDAAQMIFIDGGMHHVPSAEYELLEVAAAGTLLVA